MICIAMCYLEAILQRIIITIVFVCVALVTEVSCISVTDNTSTRDLRSGA
jgi:hypothetical protein